MPKLVWRSAYGYLPPIAEGGTMDSCLLGNVEVGRVQKVGARGAWICWLPVHSCGMPLAGWQYERSWLAARAALAARVARFLEATGVDQPEERKAPCAPAPEASAPILGPAPVQQELFPIPPGG